MATETDRLSELKCRDCAHCVLTGWWEPQKMCEITGWPVAPDGPACISILPKNKKHYGKTSD